MRNINIRAAKTHSSRFLSQAPAGEELVIARGGEPMARLAPLKPEALKPRPLGLGKDRFSLPKDFDTSHRKAIVKMFTTGS